MSTQLAPDSQLIDIHTVARRLNCSIRTVWRMEESGEMPAALRLKRLVRWDPAQLDEWIARGCPRVREDTQAPDR